MNATIVRAKRQTTLPQNVADAAGIKQGDQVEWTFEGGEIRGRKLVPLSHDKRLRLVKKKGFLMLEGKMEREDILAAIRADREGK
jgi:bifunctional DNA-binding transcriptional regulator/antitoxin component of YhaV-PrlF toxin-antitoxin module